jgi:hypothetical protein
MTKCCCSLSIVPSLELHEMYPMADPAVEPLLHLKKMSLLQQ